MFPARYFPDTFFAPRYFPKVGAEPPPPPPPPDFTGDGVYLPSFGRLDLEQERYHWQRKRDPWAFLRQLVRGFNQSPAALAEVEEVSHREKQWAQIQRVTRVTRLMRRRR